MTAVPPLETESEPVPVLVIEDDHDTQANLVDILGMAGCLVRTADSAAAARNILSECSEFRIILLDRRLPDTSADELLPELRRVVPDASVIVITGYADLDSTIRAMRQGASDYLLKPVNPEALIASVSRLLERQAMWRAWHKEHEFAERVIDTTEAIVLVLGADGTIQRCNPYFEQVTGWKQAEVVGRDWFGKMVPPAEVPRLTRVFQQTLDGKTTRGIVNAVLAKDGAERYVRWSNTLLRDLDGAPTGVLAVGLDITDIIEAQRRALQNERLAVIGETMAALAHESRNSLQRIQAKTDLLELELGDNPQALADLRSIAQATQDLHRLLEAVRGFAAPIHLERSTEHLPTLWNRALETVRSMHPDRKILLQEDIQWNRPVSVDAMRMQQVFRNLFENSVSAHAGEVHITVSVHPASAEGRLVVEVVDDGPGFGDTPLDRVFDAFFTTRPTGTGLGMAIVHRIIEAHEGTISIDPQYQQGARILMEIPSRKPSSSTAR
ncbi:MAG: PAS domain S-box protein [Planctomycetota bacterium]|nr:MAG: PAS domain S-box protein [Planctomycetota bacterium]